MQNGTWISVRWIALLALAGTAASLPACTRVTHPAAVSKSGAILEMSMWRWRLDDDCADGGGCEGSDGTTVQLAIGGARRHRDGGWLIEVLAPVVSSDRTTSNSLAGTTVDAYAFLSNEVFDLGIGALASVSPGLYLMLGHGESIGRETTLRADLYVGGNLIPASGQVRLILSCDLGRLRVGAWVDATAYSDDDNSCDECDGPRWEYDRQLAGGISIGGYALEP